MSWRATVHFYGQLRSLLSAGMAIDHALELAAGRLRGPYRERAGRWAAGCRAGRSLGEQLAQDGERPFPAAIVIAGERSGRLPELCGQVVDFYQEAIRIRSLVVSRAIYPAVLLHLCTMVPVLPLWIMGKASGWWILAGPVTLWSLVGLGALGYRFSRASGLGATLCTRFPLVELALPLVTATACLVLRAAAAAGLLWPEGLRLAADSCGNRVYAARLRAAADGIERDRLEDLTAAVSEAGFPAETIDLIATGERSGALEDALERTATLQHERFKLRVEWTARVAMGLFYALAIVVAAITIITMFYQITIAPMQEILDDG